MIDKIRAFIVALEAARSLSLSIEWPEEMLYMTLTTPLKQAKSELKRLELDAYRRAGGKL